MRRRRRDRKLFRPAQNLDSFLDILTNTVGVLMFISLFVTLLAVDSDTIIRTPLASSSRKDPHFFEIRNNQVTYIDDRSVDRQINQLIEQLPTCEQPNIPSDISPALYNYYVQEVQAYRNCINARAERLKGFQTQTSHYQVWLINAESFALLYEPREGREGEVGGQLQQASSDFRRRLQQLNPQTDYLAFVVRPDSFAAFRQARKIAWEEGFDVGWEPQPTENPIVFSSGGRAIGVQ